MPDYTRRTTWPAINPQNTTSVTFGAAHQESGAISADAVRLCATAACYVAFGSIATSGSMYLPANVPEIFPFNSGDVISVLQASAGGTLYASWGD
jgi:hypothetical protein